MNENTQKLTFGALLVAIFGVLLLLNRQTGGMLEEVLISIVCGIFTSAFYAITQSFIGAVYGSCLHAKRDSNKTMLLVMGLSAVSNLLSTIVLASLFGINIQEDLQMMQTTMRQMIEKAGVNMTPQQMQSIELLLQKDTLMRIFIVSMIFMGVVQGFIVCQLSLLILRRLRFQIQKPAPITSYYPPRWTGFIALLVFVLYSSTLAMPEMSGRQEIIRVAGQIGALCAYMYLLCFGFIAILFLLRAYGPGSRLLNIIIALAGFFVFPQLFMILGCVYISTGFHDWVVNKMGERVAREQKYRR